MLRCVAPLTAACGGYTVRVLPTSGGEAGEDANQTENDWALVALVDMGARSGPGGAGAPAATRRRGRSGRRRGRCAARRRDHPSAGRRRGRGAGQGRRRPGHRRGAAAPRQRRRPGCGAAGAPRPERGRHLRRSQPLRAPHAGDARSARRRRRAVPAHRQGGRRHVQRGRRTVCAWRSRTTRRETLGPLRPARASARRGSPTRAQRIGRGPLPGPAADASTMRRSTSASVAEPPAPLAHTIHGRTSGSTRRVQDLVRRRPAQCHECRGRRPA